MCGPMRVRAHCLLVGGVSYALRRGAGASVAMSYARGEAAGGSSSVDAAASDKNLISGRAVALVRGALRDRVSGAAVIWLRTGHEVRQEARSSLMQLFFVLADPAGAAEALAAGRAVPVGDIAAIESSPEATPVAAGAPSLRMRAAPPTAGGYSSSRGSTRPPVTKAPGSTGGAPSSSTTKAGAFQPGSASPGSAEPPETAGARAARLASTEQEFEEAMRRHKASVSGGPSARAQPSASPIIAPSGGPGGESQFAVDELAQGDKGAPPTAPERRRVAGPGTGPSPAATVSGGVPHGAAAAAVAAAAASASSPAADGSAARGSAARVQPARAIAVTASAIPPIVQPASLLPSEAASPAPISADALAAARARDDEEMAARLAKLKAEQDARRAAWAAEGMSHSAQLRERRCAMTGASFADADRERALQMASDSKKHERLEAERDLERAEATASLARQRVELLRSTKTRDVEAMLDPMASVGALSAAAAVPRSHAAASEIPTPAARPVAAAPAEDATARSGSSLVMKAQSGKGGIAAGGGAAARGNQYSDVGSMLTCVVLGVRFACNSACVCALRAVAWKRTIERRRACTTIGSWIAGARVRRLRTRRRRKCVKCMRNA